MRKFEGSVTLRNIEFEVDNDADPVEVEQAFNRAIDDRINQGFSLDEYEYEETTEEEDLLEDDEDEFTFKI